MRAAIYARYSSENQREASIEDQVRLCKVRLTREGWSAAATYSDKAISGSQVLRPGYQKLLQDVRAGRVDVVVAEALDRVSRDQEHVAGFFKQLTFAGVKLITIAEGEITELHVGLKGTMNALFLKDLAAKTHRGLRGRVEEGRSGGGLCFGYDVVKELDAKGEPVRGGRTVNEDEAAIVRRIFTEFAAGDSPETIGKRLNRAKVPGPHGTTWGPSTIYGNWRRGTGILNNELYVGRLIWNRLRYIKDPQTGKRVSKLNDKKDWTVKKVPELRIVDQDLWDKVKERQKEARSRVTGDAGTRSERARRPVYLFSGLVHCGVCGGGYTMINATQYACNSARSKGICTNGLPIRRDRLEAAILEGLKSHLMAPELVQEFVAEYHREVNRLSGSQDVERQNQEKELRQTEHGIRAIIESIKAGFRTDAMREELEALEAKKKHLKALIASKPPSSVRLHPNLAKVYRAKIQELRDALNQDETRTEASEILRALIDEVRLVPDGKKLRIHLVGQLSELFALAQNKQPGLKETGLQVTLVAGVGFEPTTFRL